jgi:hypothetical protein
MTKSDDSSTEGSFQLPVQKRSFMGSNSDAGTGSADGSGVKTEQTETPHLAPSKRNVIVPLDSSLTGSGGKFMDTKPGAKKTAASTPPKSEEQPKESEEDIANSSDDTKAAAGKGGKLDELTDEALAKREKEIQDIISSRQYFVPVDAVARRHSDKISLGMTAFILILGVILIDLLLDTGAILLLQKVPHTHFFSIYTQTNQQITTKN